MPNGFQVEPALLRGAAESVAECCRQLASERKTDAAGGMSAGLAGFAVLAACESAAKSSETAFSGVAKSWRAWSGAAVDGAADYEKTDAGAEVLIRHAGAEVLT